MPDDFSRNLRRLCADTGSIAQVCREIGMNRQQFNRYLNGHGLPSAHNLHRIARYFGLEEEALFTPHQDFRQQRGAAAAVSAPAVQFGSLFRDQARRLSRFMGVYHGYFRTPTWPGQILRTLIWLRPQDGCAVTHTFERAIARDGSIRQRSRYAGMATLRNNRICMYETPRRGGGYLSETVLMPAHPQQVSYLQGLTLGISAGPGQAPFATNTVWVRIGERTSAREALAATGAYPEASPRIDPKVRRLLGEQPPLSLSAGPQV
ncbi:helix-turn-helix transcriptional regulator [Leisingera sp. HS039]|uniref:helix-turn-helix transcriptional regulator n=1 Tax=unclassified Leisingera TaxID=2614906 RepID=UPI001071526D|nr:MULTISPECIES: helix-turn-helix transcriptional regulator [unclassified Leisingera]MBQ4824043.1 helix-turn-helix transcriptional regulator [Leisingera sp. HS039]QBR35203.1 XRE family transcriptional regulator [Leisingera sp. NJS201]